MAALMKCAALLFSSAAAAALPVSFPCNLPVTVLESHAKGWPAKCLNLVQSGTGTSTDALCKAKCVLDSDCSVWQLTSDNYCFVSKPDFPADHCWGRDGGDEFVANGGERLQHGTINVTAPIGNMSYDAGLHYVGAMTGATALVHQERCKHQCYSDIWCNKWITVAGTAADSSMQNKVGCWLQNKDSTEQGLTAIPQGLTTMGETIAHTCIQGCDPDSPQHGNLFTVLLITLLICIVLIVGLIIAILLCRKPAEKKSVNSRSVKVSPKPMQQALVPMVPMPVMVTQPTVAYAAPPAIAAPSYQVVPQAQSTTFASVPLI